jgi:hypothetical protein
MLYAVVKLYIVDCRGRYMLTHFQRRLAIFFSPRGTDCAEALSTPFFSESGIHEFATRFETGLLILGPELQI